MKNCVTLSVEIAKEVADNLSRVDPEATETLLEAIREAKRVFFAGRGRSLLMLRGLAMRLMHLGLCVYVTGETVTPAAGPGDLLLIGSGSGETTTLVPLAQQAHKLGMRVALLTIFPDSTLARLADHVVVIPGTSGKRPGNDAPLSLQPGGNLFEQSMLLLCDAAALCVAQRMGLALNDDTIMSRHANLE